LGPVVIVPAAHGAQLRSFLSVGVLIAKVPAGQVLHGVQLTLFSWALKLPLRQGSQVWSSVGVPGFST
jgi:hypothetical protein